MHQYSHLPEFDSEILKYISFKAKSSLATAFAMCNIIYFSSNFSNSERWFYFYLCAITLFAGFLIHQYPKLNIKDYSNTQIKSLIQKFIRYRFYYSFSISLLISYSLVREGLLSYAGVVSFTSWAIHHELHVANCHPIPRASYLISAIIVTIPTIGIFFSSSDIYGITPVLISCAAFGFYIASKVRMMYKRFITQFESSLKLIEENKRIENFIDMIPAHVSWFDSEMKYLLVNKSLAQIQRRDKMDFIGQRLGFSTKTNGDLISHLEKFTHDDSANDAYFEINLSTDKGSRWTEFHLKKIRAEDPEKFEVIMLGLDREQEKKISQQLEEERIKNMHSARLASLGEMGAGIAHEIKNPLTIILGQLAFCKKELQANISDREKLSYRVDKIEQTAYRILRIIEGLRKLSRDSSEQEIAWVNVDEVLSDPINLSTEKLRIRGVQLEIKNEIENYELHCQSLQISQVILNLINNADDVIKDQEEKKIRIHLYQDEDKNCIISIEDNGPGVKDEAKLFTPFYTTKAPGSGTGLGLSISKKILERNGGSLFYKRKNNMTCFQLQFPASHARMKAMPSKKVA